MAKSASRDRFLTRSTILIVVLLLLIFAVTGFYWRNGHVPAMHLKYTIVGPLAIHTATYALSARMAVQTTAENGDWAQKNGPALRKIIESALSAVNPDQVTAPGGLTTVQSMLKDAVNRGLNSDKVEQILLTDFLLQTDI